MNIYNTIIVYNNCKNKSDRLPLSILSSWVNYPGGNNGSQKKFPRVK